MKKVKSSGKTQEFSSGAHRDSQEGKGRFDLIPTIAWKRLAQHYEIGANKYGEDNWKKGMPLKRFLDSAFRHLIKCLDSEGDEDHEAAVLWNMCGFMYTKNAIERGVLPQELDDLPRYSYNKYEAQEEDEVVIKNPKFSDEPESVEHSVLDFIKRNQSYSAAEVILRCNELYNFSGEKIRTTIVNLIDRGELEYSHTGHLTVKE